MHAPPTIGYLSADVISAGDKLFDEAEKLTNGNPVASEYIAKNRLCLRYVEVMQRAKADDAFRSFVADAKKFGITQIREGMPVDAWTAEFEKAHPATQP